ncbi:ABC transporter ATP-binding protein [Spartinivicinus ruber]|uniref:ABC transporter ATP-binding protein n=1 Tax=Spartinivicinus ruber TaxID=2683272 RepID=UPI0013D0B6CA|nr:ABC transporter ATP-binding protein [Spartinivicinus ruber]
MSKIEVNNVSLVYRKYQDGATSAKEYFASLLRRKNNTYSDFSALKDVTFTVKGGERLGIVGRNGTGKSTLLKAICGVYQPTKGRVRVQGNIAPLLEIGAGFHPEFTGRENIYFNGAILGYSRLHLEEIENEVFEFAELQDFIDTPVKYYSTGMYMRLAFSLATTFHPDILVLDELFVGGDASFIKRGKERMNKMIDRSNVMVLVSHDQSLLRSLCDRFIWLDQGKVVADGDSSVLDAYMSS